MDLSTIYIALVFLAPLVLGLSLLSAMASDLDLAGFVAARPKTPSTATTGVINRTRDDVGCYA